MFKNIFRKRDTITLTTHEVTCLNQNIRTLQQSIKRLEELLSDIKHQNTLRYQLSFIRFNHFKHTPSEYFDELVYDKKVFTLFLKNEIRLRKEKLHRLTNSKIIIKE